MLVQGWSHRMNKQFCPYVLAFTPVSIVPSLGGWQWKIYKAKTAFSRKYILVKSRSAERQIITSWRSLIQFKSAFDRLGLVFCQSIDHCCSTRCVYQKRMRPVIMPPFLHRHPMEVQNPCSLLESKEENNKEFELWIPREVSYRAEVLSTVINPTEATE